jgi:hypothetical protein
MFARCWVFVGVVALCTLTIAPVGESFKFGQPDEIDDPTKAARAMNMLRNLRAASEESAESIRKMETDSRDERMRADSTFVPHKHRLTDMFGWTYTYFQELTANPPHLSTERNLVALQNDIHELAKDAALLRQAVHDALSWLNANAGKHDPPPMIERESHTCKAVLVPKLIRVQGVSYTVIQDGAAKPLDSKSPKSPRSPKSSKS